MPTGGVVTAGQAAIGQSGSTLTVTQTSQKTILNWQSFNIGSQAAVDFQQPNASAIALNRVLSADPSTILGKLSANGQVVLVNPNGVVFGGGSRVDVGGLVASTLDIKDSDFLAGNLTFQRGNATGSITNQGTLAAANGGTIALLSPQITNQGLIQAKLGSVALASGDAVTLSLNGAGGLVAVKVDPATVKSQITQGGAIVASDGQVFLTARAANALLGGAISLGGSVEADSLTAKGGEVVLEASGPIDLTGHISASGATDGGKVSVISDGATTVSGAITAKGGSGSGGQVETSGGSLAVGGATITVGGAKAGNWLLDPYDLTVDASAAVTIANTLATGNVTLQTTATGSSGPGTATVAGNGDIIINSALTWSGNTTLTLNAWRNIAINANLIASGASAGLVMNAGQGVSSGTDLTATGASVTLSGANAGLSIGGHSYTLIHSAADVQGMGTSGYYALAGNIDLGSISNFSPIGYSSANTTSTVNGSSVTGVNATPTAFAGAFDGLGHSLSNLTITNKSANNLGLFAEIGLAGVVRNVTLNGSLTAGDGISHVGMVTGWNLGTIANVSGTGVVISGSAAEAVGGLVGANYGIVGTSTDSGQVVGGSGAMAVGGLVGANIGGSITGSSSSAVVSGGSGSYGVGGLVGASDVSAAGTPAPVIAGSWATGAVSGSAGASYIGGLVGENEGSVTASYATGAVTGGSGAANLGGLVGGNVLPAVGAVVPVVSTSYASGAVSAPQGTWLGGLVGWNQGTVSTSYAIGAVSGSGSADMGGLVGGNDGSVSGSWSSGAVSGTQLAGGLVGVNAGSVSSSFWDTASSGLTTGIGGGSATGATGLTTTQAMTSSSYTSWNFTNTWYLVSGDTRPFLRSEYSTTITNAHQLQLASLNLGASYVLGGNITMPTLTAAGMWSTSTGFVPIGNGSAFTGKLDGKGFAISGLVIAGSFYDAGLVGNLGVGGSVTNLILNNANVSSTSTSAYLGGVVGYNAGVVNNVSIAGSVSGGSIYSLAYTGGLVGVNYGTVSNSSSSASVSYGQEVGGLVGYQAGAGTITNSYASGAVTGGTYLGGLVGYQYGGSVTNSYASGAVGSASYAGGLIGNKFAGTVLGSYWDTTTTGRSTAGTGVTSGATGLTDAQAKLASSYAGWDFTNTWFISSSGYPKLQALRPTLTVTANNATVAYGSTSLPALSFSYSGFVGGDSSANLSALPTATTATGPLAAGTYSISGAGAVDSDYVIVYQPGTLTVTPKVLTWSVGSATSVYGTLAAPQITLSGVLAGDTVTGLLGVSNSSGSLSLSTTTPAGTYATSVTGLSGAAVGNYTLSSTGGTAGTLTITPAPLTVTVGNASRNYGSLNPSLTFTYSGFVGGDSATSLTSQPILRTTATTSSAPGTYAIVAYGAVDPNYRIIYVPGTLSVVNPVTGMAKTAFAPATGDFSSGALLTAFANLAPLANGGEAGNQ